MKPDCSVTLTRIKGLQAEEHPTPPVEENSQMRRTGRKRTVKDNSKLLNYDEDDEPNSNLPPLPVKCK